MSVKVNSTRVDTITKVFSNSLSFLGANLSSFPNTSFTVSFLSIGVSPFHFCHFFLLLATMHIDNDMGLY